MARCKTWPSIRINPPENLRSPGDFAGLSIGVWPPNSRRVPTVPAARDEPLAVLAQQFAERMAWLGLTLDRIRAAMRAWEVDRQLPPAARGQLLPAQLRALAVVPSPADRARLALQAVDASWTAAQTANEVGAYRLRTGL